jgi:two-component system LytT family response regulator
MRPLAARGSDAGYPLHLFVPLATGGVFLAYLLVLSLTNSQGLLSNILSALCSVVPLVLLGLAIRAIVRAFVRRLPLAGRLVAHMLLGAAFAFLWYWVLMVLLAFTSGKSLLHFDVRPVFPGPAVAWQLMQGVTLYCLVIALIHLEGQTRTPDLAPAADSKEPPALANADPALSRYFVKKGEEIQPVDVRQIVSISGAGDYAEVCTLAGRHLARMTLAQFETALRNERFIRVHRSKIVNLDRVARAEPAGAGRILLHMENGESVLASRAGSRLFRERVI